MVRSIWKKTLVSSLAWAGMAVAQQPQTIPVRPIPSTPAVGSAERVITVQEAGKPAQKCRMLKSWKTAQGAKAYQVQALDSGEIMTIVESGPVTTVPGSNAGTRMQAMATRIFHWGRSQAPPEGTPMPPVEVVQTVPTTKPATVPCEVPCQETVTKSVVATPTEKVVRPGFFARFTHKDETVQAMTPPKVAQAKPTDQYNTKSDFDSKSSQDKLVKVLPPKVDEKKDAAAEKKAAESKKAATTLTTKAPTPSTEPAEWRKSWGKTDDHKSTVQAPVENKIVSKPALPQADTKRPDPLMQVPERYVKKPVDEAPKAPKLDLIAPVNAVAQPKPVVQVKEVSTTAAPTTTQFSMPSKVPQVPAGAQSVVGASEGAPDGVRYIPVPVVTMPDYNHPPAPPMPNMPRPPQVVQQYDGMSYANASAQNKAPGPNPTTYDPGLVNAFTSMPSDAQVAKATNAFGTPEPGAMAAMAPQMARPMQPAMYARAPGSMMMPQSLPPAQMQMASASGISQVGYQTAGATQQHMQAAHHMQQMQTVLRDSLYPSQREWAAESLASVDWRTHPQVVQALTAGAKDDPAATVRAACVHCLGKMKANTVPVVTTIQGLKSDPDPRVRHEVEATLAALSK